MMDQFLEEVVTKQKRGMQGIMIALASVVMVVSAFVAVFYMNMIISAVFSMGFSTQLILPVIIFLVSVGLAILLYLRRDRLRTEYEYTFTNGILDFAQVFNNKHRKPLGTMNLKNVEACGLVSSGSFRRYINMPGIKRNNWFLNREAELLYLYFSKNDQKRIIVIEPSEQMIQYIKGALSQGAWQTN